MHSGRPCWPKRNSPGSILDQVERAIERVAMRAPGADRQQDLQARVKDIRTRMDEARSQAVALRDLPSVPAPGVDQQPAITLPELEAVLTSAEPTAERLHPHPDIPGAYLLQLQVGKIPVTFRRSVLDEHAPAIRLPTYGTQELNELLKEAGAATSLINGRFIVSGHPVSSVADLPIFAETSLTSLATTSPK
jgi:hypothetical protein